MIKKFMPTKDYINLCIEESNRKSTPEAVVESTVVRDTNINIINTRMEHNKKAASFRKFSSDVKKSFLAECIYRLFDGSLVVEESMNNERVKRVMIDRFLEENGVGNLLLQFKHKTLLLSEYSRLVEKYTNLVLESVDKNNEESYTIDSTIKDNFFEELDLTDTDEVIDSIKVRVSDAVADFINSNIIAKSNIEETIKAAQANIDSAKTEELKESFELAAKRKITNQRVNKHTNVFEKFVTEMTKSVMKNDKLKEMYMENNKLNMDKIVESCKIMYTFLETVNTSQILNVNEDYIRETLASLS